jgi:hypothetical protein
MGSELVRNFIDDCAKHVNYHAVLTDELVEQAFEFV